MEALKVHNSASNHHHNLTTEQQSVNSFIYRPLITEHHCASCRTTQDPFPHCRVDLRRETGAPNREPAAEATAHRTHIVSELQGGAEPGRVGRHRPAAEPITVAICPAGSEVVKWKPSGPARLARRVRELRLFLPLVSAAQLPLRKQRAAAATSPNGNANVTA